MRCRLTRSVAGKMLIAFCLILPATLAHGNVTTYTDAADFASAVSTGGFTTTVLDFESVAPGSVFGNGSTIGAIEFDGFVAPDLIVADNFATTSGTNYLGMNDANFASQFLGGFEFDMQFDSSNAIGLLIITGETPGFSIFDSDIVIEVPGVGTAELDVDDLQGTIGGTDNVFFIGLVDDMSTFTTARLRYDPSAISAIVFNIDDIQTAAGFVLGDVNRDGVVNLLDVQPFVELISDGGFQPEADINMDGAVNLLDIGPFIDLLTN